jgi:hypothetical protein
VAPFDYTSMLWALLLGYLVFGELPTRWCSWRRDHRVGGLFVIWRERQLGLQRARDAEGPPAATWSAIRPPNALKVRMVRCPGCREWSAPSR